MGVGKGVGNMGSNREKVGQYGVGGGTTVNGRTGDARQQGADRMGNGELEPDPFPKTLKISPIISTPVGPLC